VKDDTSELFLMEDLLINDAEYWHVITISLLAN